MLPFSALENCDYVHRRTILCRTLWPVHEQWYNGNMKRLSKFSAAITLAAFAAIPVAPAHADPTGCENPSPTMAEFCRSLEDLKGYGTTTPAPATPATSTGTSGSGGGLGDWVSDHAIWIVLIVGGLIAWAVIAGLREEKATDQKEAATRDAATLARGRAIAEAWYEEQVAKAHAEAAAKVPDRSVYDPAGVGLAPPPPPPVVMPAPPAMADEDLRRYATFGAYVSWEHGTAFAQAITRSGDDAPIRSAWFQACQLAGLGETDPETGTFTPAATVAWIAAVGDGDVEVSVDTRDYTVGDQQLNRALRHLERTARVAAASPFVRNPAKDWFSTRLSMQQQAAPAPAPAQPTPAAAQPAAEQVDPDDPWS